MSNEKTPHVHHDCIVAWAKGEKIEMYSKSLESWVTVLYPTWAEKDKYRIRQDPKKPRYLCYKIALMRYQAKDGSDYVVLTVEKKAYQRIEQKKYFHSWQSEEITIALPEDALNENQY